MQHPNVHRIRSRARAVATWILAALVVSACSGEAPLPGDPLRLVSERLSDPVVGEPYTHDLTPVGGLRPYTFALEEGRLPPGMALQGGTLLGTPTEIGRYEFTVSVSDANLASTYERFVLEVRDLPLPRLELTVPDTEVRDAVTLRARVTDVRNLRAVRARIDLHDLPIEPTEVTVRATRDDVALFHEVRDGEVAVDAAVLGEPLGGEVELFRLDLVVSEPVVLGMDVRAEFLYADRHHFVQERAGAPAAGDTTTIDEEPGSGPPDVPQDGDPDADPGDADDGPDGDPAGGPTGEGEGAP